MPRTADKIADESPIIIFLSNAHSTACCFIRALINTTTKMRGRGWQGILKIPTPSSSSSCFHLRIVSSKTLPIKSAYLGVVVYFFETVGAVSLIKVQRLALILIEL